MPEPAGGPDPTLLPPLLQGKELLAQKLPLWQQACADPNKVPERAVQLLQQLANSDGAVLPGALSASKSSLLISDPIPGAKPLPVPPELAPFVGVSAWPWKAGPGGGGPCSGRHPAGAGGPPPCPRPSPPAGPVCNPAPSPPLPTAAVRPGERAHHEWRLGPRQRRLQPLG